MPAKFGERTTASRYVQHTGALILCISTLKSNISALYSGPNRQETIRLSKIVVQKFGGTSVENEAGRQRAVGYVKQKLTDGFRPVVVVSAMGRRGAPYATDTLLDLGRSSGGQLDSRESDLLVSCGETISAVIMSQHLIAEGIPASPLTGGQAGLITDGAHGGCQIRRVETGKLISLLNSGRVPVVAGFQGISEDGEITTFGRGGSDSSACIIGAALDVHSVEIFTDVDGVMTADPRVVPNSKLIGSADYTEIRALAQNGSKVITPDALEVAAIANIPVTIRSSLTSTPGTTIHFRTPSAPVTGIASYSNITYFRIRTAGKEKYAIDLKIFRQIADARISVHFIDIHPTGVAFVADSDWTSAIEEILREKSCQFTAADGFSKISVVGVGMTGQPGMMATIIDALNKIDVPIYQSTDAQTSISCLVKTKHEEIAVRALHDAFNLGDA